MFTGYLTHDGRPEDVIRSLEQRSSNSPQQNRIEQLCREGAEAGFVDIYPVGKGVLLCPDEQTSQGSGLSPRHVQIEVHGAEAEEDITAFVKNSRVLKLVSQETGVTWQATIVHGLQPAMVNPAREQELQKRGELVTAGRGSRDSIIG